MAVDSDLLRRRVERLEGLPTLPSVASSLLALTRNPKTSATQVGELISKDQALTTRVLRLVNSAYYGFPKKISTINHAVVILGFSRVKNIVLAASVFAMEKLEQPSAFDPAAFWRHSLGAAVCARAVSRELHCGEHEEAFVCGLLHDVGKVVLAQVAPDDYRQALSLAASRSSLIRDAEEAVLGLDHAEVGSWLVERWQLPPGVQSAVRRHHQPGETRQDRETAVVVSAADVLARSLQVGSGGDRSLPAFDPAAVADLGLNAGVLAGLVPRCIEDLRRSAEFFEMIEG
jgi:putative nucleotidyltransferase with HDIG domain